MTVRVDFVTLALIAIAAGGAWKWGPTFLLVWGLGGLTVMVVEELRRR